MSVVVPFVKMHFTEYGSQRCGVILIWLGVMMDRLTVVAAIRANELTHLGIEGSTHTCTHYEPLATPQP